MSWKNIECPNAFVSILSYDDPTSDSCDASRQRDLLVGWTNCSFDGEEYMLRNMISRCTWLKHQPIVTPPNYHYLPLHGAYCDEVRFYRLLQ